MSQNNAKPVETVESTMARNLKPAEKRRMREQLAETERDIARLKERAQKFAGSWIGRDALNKARDAEESAQRLRMYVQPNARLSGGPA